MSEKKGIKKRMCNDKDAKELSRKVQEIKHQYTIEVLNYHCLGEIISYLDPVDRLNLEKLCEKIRVASNFAWRRITSLEMSTSLTSGTIKQCSIKAGGAQNITKQILVRCGNYLESLHVGACRIPLMSSIFNKCHNLRKLTIDYQFFDGKNFKDAFKNMKNLKYIKIKLFENNDTGILKSLPEDIEEISVESSRHNYSPPLILPEDFKDFSNTWKALRSLSLRQFIIDKGSSIIFNKNYPLTQLNLFNCRLTDIHQTKLLLSNYRNLKHLDLMDSGPANDDIINTIVNSFQNLKHLNISGYKSISSKGLEELRKLKNLEEIYLTQLPVDDGVLAKFKNLRILDCSRTSVRYRCYWYS